VPLAVVARSGTTTVFLDAWTVRRERIETPPGRYWAGRMSMRPWDVFLAQVLQFQCHLHELLDPAGRVTPTDPCVDVRDAARDAKTIIGQVGDVLRTNLAFPIPLTTFADLHLKLDRVLKPFPLARRHSVLIDGGMIEVPSAGYLPIEPGTIVNDYAVAMLGRGVDLRVCRVTPDYVPHALEAAQHMERISLIAGLERGGRRPQVDVLVPDGEAVTTVQAPAGLGFEGTLHVRPEFAGAAPAATTSLASPTSTLAAVAGAGRGERLDAGGGAFYFAGTSDVPHRLKIADLARAWAAIGKTDLMENLQEINRLPRTKVADQPGTLDPSLYSNVNVIAGKAALFSTSLRDKFDAFTEVVRPPEDLPTFAVPTPATEKRLVNAWVAMRSDLNLIALPAETAGRVDFHVMLGSPGAEPSWVEHRVQGELSFTRIERVGSTVQAAGFLQDVSSSTRGVIEGTVIERFDSRSIAVQCVVADTVPRRKVTARFLHGRGNGFRIELTWRVSPADARLDVFYEYKGRFAETLIASGIVNENNAVLGAGHPRHALAVSAVNVLGALAQRPDFAARALARLFPPIPPPPAELRLRATRDWIFFHRRRVKDCAVVAPRPEPTPPRRYQVWQLQVPNVAAAQQIRQALLTNQPDKLPDMAPIAPVEFGGGVAVMTSNPAALLHDWSQAPRGNVLQYSLIASQGTLDGDPLARARLDQVEAALAQTLTPDVHALTDATNFVPAKLRVPETDGSIVLLTRSEVKTTCHTVFRVDPRFAEMALGFIKENRIAELAQQRICIPLGKLEFAGDSAQFTSDAATRQQVLANWDARGDGPPDRVLGFAASADAAASAQPQLTDRVKAIGTLLRSDARSIVTAAAVDAPMPEGCSGATFVIPRVTMVRAAVIRINEDITPSVAKLLADGDVATLVSKAKPLGGGLFRGGSDVPFEPLSILKVKDQIPNVAQGAWIVFTRPGAGAEAETEAVRKAQATAIAAAAELPGQVVIAPKTTTWTTNEFLEVVLAIVSTQVIGTTAGAPAISVSANRLVVREPSAPVTPRTTPEIPAQPAPTPPATTPGRRPRRRGDDQ